MGRKVITAPFEPFKEHNDAIAALNLKSAIVYRSFVARKQLKREEDYLLRVENRIADEATKSSGEGLIQNMESNLRLLRECVRNRNLWRDNLSLSQGLIDRFDLLRDPEVDLAYLTKLANTY